jgi:hypothetical protein
MNKELSKDAENVSSANLTAVDFLIQEIKADALVCVKSIDEWNQVFRQAKEMEKKQQGYSEEDMISFAEFIATHPDKNRNVYGETLHAKSKYDGAERTVDLLEQFKKK